MTEQEKIRFLSILSGILALTAVLLCFDLFWREASEPDPSSSTSQTPSSIQDTGPLLREKGPMKTFREAPWARASAEQQEGRSLQEYYSRRAFPGAPPVIPHSVKPEMEGSDDNCETCHQYGGYVPKFYTYAPPMPHGEKGFDNCRQCHVPQTTASPYSETNWSPPQPPELDQRAMPSAPPIIPHTLENREFCLSCHAGPSSPPDIRTDHPGRSNCMQCHVSMKVHSPWQRDR